MTASPHVSSKQSGPRYAPKMTISCGTSIVYEGLQIHIVAVRCGSFCVVTGNHSWRRKKKRKKREKLTRVKRRIRLGAEKHRPHYLVTLSRGENSAVRAENQNTVHVYLD